MDSVITYTKNTLLNLALIFLGMIIAFPLQRIILVYMAYHEYATNNDICPGDIISPYSFCHGHEFLMWLYRPSNICSNDVLHTLMISKNN